MMDNEHIRHHIQMAMLIVAAVLLSTAIYLEQGLEQMLVMSSVELAILATCVYFIYAPDK